MAEINAEVASEKAPSRPKPSQALQCDEEEDHVADYMAARLAAGIVCFVSNSLQ